MNPPSTPHRFAGRGEYELIAMSTSDGWALVRDGDRYWSLRPPYRLENRGSISLLQVSRALAEEGFRATSETFRGWGTLVRFVADKRVAAAEATSSRAEPDRVPGAVERLLARTTAAQAREHLNHLAEALDTHPRAAVVTALLALLQAESVVGSPQLVRRAAELLKAAREHRPASARSASESWSVANEDEVNRISRDIASRHSVLFRSA